MTDLKALMIPCAVLALGACSGAPANVTDTSPTIGTDRTATSELVCSVEARDNYLETARAKGLRVEDNGETATVIARTAEQKAIAQDLYRQQLADLDACARNAS